MNVLIIFLVWHVQYRSCREDAVMVDIYIWKALNLDESTPSNHRYSLQLHYLRIFALHCKS